MLDYALFRNVLEELYSFYPKGKHYTELDSLKKQRFSDREKVMCYLAEHGMISMPCQKHIGGQISYAKAVITAHGIDFLQPDGGLSALNAPVIRIAPESLAGIIEAALSARNIPAEQRSVIKNALGIAGTEGVKIIVQRLINAGIAHAPDLVRMFTLP